MRILIAASAAAAAVVLSASPALAATQGSLSTTTSSGTAVFTAVIPPMVRISGLSDLTINVTPAALTSPYFSFEDTNEKFCVYSNVGAAGTYSIKVDGNAGTTQPFALTGPGGNLGFDVWVSDDPNNVFIPGSYFYPGQTNSSYTTTAGGGARPTTIDCTDSGPDASLEVRLNNADVLAAQAGTYTGTLTLTVSAI